jgi:hypothetical protein
MAGTRDCVMMLDEFDKLGRGMHGDPAAAMLVVLFPIGGGTCRRRSERSATAPKADASSDTGMPAGQRYVG